MNELFIAIKRLFTGYDTENNLKDKEIQDNLKEAQRRVEENKKKNGGVYVPPIDHLTPWNEKAWKENGMLIAAGILLVLMIFKD